MLNKNTIAPLIKQVKTPFYLYDYNEVERRITDIKNNFPKETKLYYSIKANPNIGLVKAMQNEIDGVEVASLGELAGIIDGGVDIENIILHGPAKCAESLRLAIEHQIKAIVVDSYSEVAQINALCQQLKKKMDVIIRVNPAFTPKGYKFITSGAKHIKLGVYEADVEKTIAQIKASDSRLRLTGFHCYLGARLLDHDAYIYNVKNTTALFKSYLHEVDSETIHLTFGSGIGATYFPEEESFSFTGVKKLVSDEIAMLSAHSGKPIEHILELGSYLVVDSGYYVTKVANVKSQGDYHVAITDGGINHNQSCIYRSRWEERPHEDSHPIQVHQEDPATNTQHYDIFGPICSEVDALAKDIQLPSLSAGDHIIVGKSGGYCLTDSMVLFLSHGIPAEYLLKDNKILEIKPRQEGVQYLAETFNEKNLLSL